MPNILLVCTANRCRSPMAMAILQRLLAGDSRHDWQVSSAGTWSRDSFPAMPHSCAVMAELGLDLSAHRSRAVNAEILVQQHLVLVMEAGHREALALEFPDYGARIALLSALAGPPFDIKDPVAGTLKDYRTTAQLLYDLLTEGLPAIQQRALARATASTP